MNLMEDGYSQTMSDSPQYVIPDDLYVPPDALIVILQSFEGPLDLLLYLIRRQNVDILDIPIADVTKQYMVYIEMMTQFRFELAGDYLVMAATLAEIKSRMMLPRQESIEEEEDPREQLVRQLLAYEVYKNAAQEIDGLPQVDRDVFLPKVEYDRSTVRDEPPRVPLASLLTALTDVIERQRLQSDYHIHEETISVGERMATILARVSSTDKFLEFSDLFEEVKSKMEVVVTFVATLELVKSGLIVVIQSEFFAPIYVRKRNEDQAG